MCIWGKIRDWKMSKTGMWFLAGMAAMVLLAKNEAQAQAADFGYSAGMDSPRHGKCEPITIPLCKDIAYNETIMPNLLNHQKQDDAGMKISDSFPTISFAFWYHLCFGFWILIELTEVRFRSSGYWPSFSEVDLSSFDAYQKRWNDHEFFLAMHFPNISWRSSADRSFHLSKRQTCIFLGKNAVKIVILM